MIPNSWGAIDWWIPAAIMLLIAAAMIVWGYTRAKSGVAVKTGLMLIKLTAFALLLICLLEPNRSYERAEPGSNLVVVMADNSGSLQVKDNGQTQTRAELLKSRLESSSPWLGKIEKDFDVRKYTFNDRLRSVSDFSEYSAEETGSDIYGSLSAVSKRFEGRPNAGVLLFTDGNTTNDLAGRDLSKLPPIYPVVVGSTRPARDIGIVKVSTSQSNFESAPVSISTELITHGLAGDSVTVRLVDEKGKQLDKQEVRDVRDQKPFAVRFQLKPEDRGVQVFYVEAIDSSLLTEESPELHSDALKKSDEATIANNRRTILVDRGRGPFRVIYVTGRPNWEFKFLNRAISEDDELEMVSLIRLAKKEPKFTFRSHQGESTNSMFRGFGNQDDDTAEQYDEPVIIRLGARDAEELRDGFPKDEDTLFEYDAVILDDVEAEYFTQDQKSLLQQFVSRRGGGLLMLGGQESFDNGEFERTPIGEMLPVYCNQIPITNTNGEFRLDLTRDGWLQPWVRMNSTEDVEQRRILTMPGFQTINAVKTIKPGATVLANVKTDSGQQYPALVVQPFGKGKSAALLIGDFWRWHMKTPEKNNDLKKSWRQTIRWLVSDVSRRVEIETGKMPMSNRVSLIKVHVKDEKYRAYDNAKVKLLVTPPEGKPVELDAEPTGLKAGEYAAEFVARESGAYRVNATVTASDGSAIETRASGWVSDVNAEEFQTLVPNRALLQELADRTGGEMIELNDLDSFASQLPSKKVPITTTEIEPWWHRWSVFLVVVGLLVSEWGIRRWKGLP